MPNVWKIFSNASSRDGSSEPSIHSLWRDERFQKAVEDFCQRFLDHPDLKGADVLSIGQSPYLLSYVMQPVIEARANFVAYVPFSEPAGLSAFDINDPKIQGYFKFLESKNITPQNIIERHKQDGVKTVMFDLAISGHTAADFYNLLFLWAEEQGVTEDFKDAFEVVLLPEMFPEKACDLFLGKFDVDPIMLEDESFSSGSIFSGQKSLASFLLKPACICLGDRFRMIAHFPPQDWTSDPRPVAHDKHVHGEAVLSVFDPVRTRLLQNNQPHNVPNDLSV